MIKRIEVHNSENDEDGLKHVPIDISFTAVGIIYILTEKELIAAMEKWKETAEIRLKQKKTLQPSRGYTVSYIATVL